MKNLQSDEKKNYIEFSIKSGLLLLQDFFAINISHFLTKTKPAPQNFVVIYSPTTIT